MTNFQPNEVPSLDDLSPVQFNVNQDFDFFDSDLFSFADVQTEHGQEADPVSYLSDGYSANVFDEYITCKSDTEPLKETSEDALLLPELLDPNAFLPEFDAMLKELICQMQETETSPHTGIAADDIQHIEDTSNDVLFPSNPRPTIQSIVDALFRSETPTMLWISQPPESHRFRYETDGIRYLETSRQNPPAIQLPNLTGIPLATDQGFGVELTLVTTTNNPGQRTYQHQHRLQYNEDGVIQNGKASVRLPLQEKDLYEGKKKLRHLSIIRLRQRDYSYQLIPHPYETDLEVEEYSGPTGRRVTKGEKAKAFDTAYRTNQCRIMCQLMVRDGEQWFATEIFCVSHTIVNPKP